MARADEGEPMSAQQQDWQQRLARGAALQADGAARKAEATRLLSEKQAACAKKFLVNPCRNQAHQEYVTASRQGLLLESEGKAIERQVHQEQLADKDRQRELDAPLRAADMQARQAEREAEIRADEEKRAARLAEKASKAEEGAKRKAEDAEKLSRRQAAHDARVAEKVRAAGLNGGGGSATK